MFEVSIVQGDSSAIEARSGLVDHLDRIGVASFPSFVFWATNRAARAKWWRSVISDSEAMVVVATRRMDGQPIGFAVCFVHEDGTCLARLSRDTRALPRILSMLVHPMRAAALVARKLNARSFRHDRVEIEQAQPSRGREMFVDQFAVCPTARGQGVARGLLRATIEAAADLRCDWVGLRVEAANYPAISLYRAMGLRVSNADHNGLRMGGAVELLLKNNLVRKSAS